VVPRKPKPSGKQIGVRVPPEIEALIEQMVADLQAQAGPGAKVTTSSFILGLVVQEGKKRKKR
jgi:hypothetical protein